jgi:hypothetical protein
MNERIKELAEQAGATDIGLDQLEKFIDLERFAELVRHDEREACAKLCEEGIIGDNSRNDYERMNCAAAIRGRTK